MLTISPGTQLISLPEKVTPFYYYSRNLVHVNYFTRYPVNPNALNFSDRLIIMIRVVSYLVSVFLGEDLMNSLLDFLVIWLAISLFIIGTSWYVTVVIPPRFPHWWRQVVVDIDPDSQLVLKK